MAGLAASVGASAVAYFFEWLLSGHVSEGVSFTVSFFVWAIVFVPSFVYLKRLREEMGL
jgi:ABC-type thiamin/hydroxymethylpyrimidine transport system permease subunit